MKTTLINILFLIRSKVSRVLFPASAYPFPIRTVQPLSRKFGIDRGTPIDRYYIEQYLSEIKDFITGACLEIGDDRYIQKFGKKVTKIDILDLNVKNTKATIYGDLRHVSEIKSNSYDCIILTQVIGMIDDCDKVISECYRILKSNGALIITTSSLAPVIDYDYSYWRFTVKSLEYLLNKKFDSKNVNVRSFGNSLSSIYYYVGGVQEELSKNELEYNDKLFPCIIASVAIKKQKYDK